MADLIMRPHAATLMYGVGHQSTLDADMAELEISPDSQLVGKTIRDAGTRKNDAVLIVSVRRPDGEQIFNPDADVEFQAGDTLVVIGKTDAVRGFKAAYGVDEIFA
jgi:Trk K+ transport system NAD-binding subunit